jgi:hypothetical protein
LEHFFPYIGNTVIIPTDFHIFQRGWNYQPGGLGQPTGNWRNASLQCPSFGPPHASCADFFQPMKGYGHTGSWNRTRKCLTFGLRIGVWCTWELQLLLPSFVDFVWFCPDHCFVAQFQYWLW